MDDSSTTLGIHWSFGFSKDCVNSVNNLTTPDRNAIFFLNSHSGVIYDYEKRSQLILQGHTHIITSCAISQDKRWIVTADVGPESILVVWDSQTGAPVKTFFSPQATPNRFAYFSIAEDSKIPGRSLLSKINGLSNDPVAFITFFDLIFNNL